MLRIITIYISLLCSLWANQIIREPLSQDILLQNLACNTQKAELLVSALQAWQEILDEQVGTYECNQHDQIVLNSLIPTNFKETILRPSMISGPNCWNAALVGTKILSSLRFSNADEMSFYMSSPLCQQVDKLEPGDIIAIRNKSHQEIHGMIYLTDQSVLSKNGPYHKRTLNIFDDLQDGSIELLYKVQKECRGQFKQGCQQYSNYFRCQTMKNYLELNPARKSLRTIKSSIEKLAKEIEKRTYYNSELPYHLKNNLIKIEKKLQKKIWFAKTSELFLQRALLKRIPLLIKQSKTSYISASMSIYGFNSDVDE